MESERNTALSHTPTTLSSVQAIAVCGLFFFTELAAFFSLKIGNTRETGAPPPSQSKSLKPLPSKAVDLPGLNEFLESQNKFFVLERMILNYNVLPSFKLSCWHVHCEHKNGSPWKDRYNSNYN